MGKKKVVINTCFGGFGLSDKAYERLIELGVPVKAYEEKADGYSNEKCIYDDTLAAEGGRTRVGGQRYWEVWSDSRTDRSNPLIVQVVEELGEEANGFCASLSVVEIPDGVEYTIEEYDGNEHIAEVHRTWS